MGCGISTDAAGTGVVGNTVTQNGRASLHPTAAQQPNTTPDTTATTKEDKSDLNLDDPELEEAATKIQAAFRGHRTREHMKMAQEEVDIDLNDPEVGKAATKIQASFRGHKARKQINEKPKDESAELTEEMEKLQTDKEKEGGEGAAAEGEEELDIDLSDPDLNKAATKIQAQFRGHVVRKPKDSE